MSASDLQNAIALLIQAFSKYSNKEGDKHTLTKSELKQLLEGELGDFMGNCSDTEQLNKLFKAMDENQDDTVDFKEYTAMISCIAVMCHGYFTKK